MKPSCKWCVERHGNRSRNASISSLVVEDKELLRLNVDDFSADGGVIDAGHAEAALEIIAARPDVPVSFTDIQMPGAINGMDFPGAGDDAECPSPAMA